MKKQLLTLVFLLSTLVLCKGQVTFQKTYGGGAYVDGRSVQQTMDGGYIIAGIVAGDFFLLKTNSFGDTAWTKTFGGVMNDEGFSVLQTLDGGYSIVGYTSSFGVGDYNVYLIKTDTSGNLLWSKTYGGIDFDFANSIQQTNDGGFIIIGYTISFGAGFADIYLIKTDINGDTLWSRTFGGSGDERGFSVQQTKDKGYILTAYTTSFGLGQQDIYLLKTDSLGNLLWSKTYGETNYDSGHSVKETTDGGFIIAGGTNSFSLIGNAYLIRTDSIGNPLWSRTFGNTGGEAGRSVQQTSDGGFILAGISLGTSNQDAYLVKTDTNGNWVWTKSFDGTSYDEANSIQQTTDGGYIITGLTYISTGNRDIYLIKTDSLGNSGCNESTPATTVTTPATLVTSPVTIVTSPTTIVTTPATIVGSGGIVITLCTSTGVTPSPLERAGVRLFPNPSAGIFTISFADKIINGEIEIYNLFGEKVYSSIITPNCKQQTVNSKLPSGIYFVKMFDGEKSYCAKLMVISSKNQ